MPTTDRLGLEEDGSDDSQRDEPDAGRHRHRQLGCSVGCGRDGVTDGGVAVGAENGESEDRSEPVETRRRVVQLAHRVPEYPLLHARQLLTTTRVAY